MLSRLLTLRKRTHKVCKGFIFSKQSNFSQTKLLAQACENLKRLLDIFCLCHILPSGLQVPVEVQGVYVRQRAAQHQVRHNFQLLGVTGVSSTATFPSTSSFITTEGGRSWGSMAGSLEG